MATLITGANRHDMKKLAELLDALVVPAVHGDESHITLDRGYDYASCYDAAIERGYTPHIPPKASKERPLPPPGDPKRHPPRRWRVPSGCEVAHSWFNRFRRVLIRWEKQSKHYLGFVQLAAILIIYRKVRHARLLSE